MLWFKRLFANRHKPVGMPNFATAPWVDIDLSGTKLRFKNPPKSQDLIPPKHWPESLDIYNLNNLEFWPNGKGAVRVIFKNHWAYYGNLFDNDTGDIAGLDVQINVTRLGIKHRIVDKLLHAKQSLHWCFNRQYSEFNTRNEWIKKKLPTTASKRHGRIWHHRICPPLALHIHPQTPEDIKTLTPPTGIPYFVYKTRLDDLPWKQVWHTAITEGHSIAIVFSVGADLNLSDIPETEAEIEKTIAEFMANFHIKYTPSTLEKMAEIKRESEHAS